MARRKQSDSVFSDDLIDQLLEGRERGAHLLCNDGLGSVFLKKRLAKRMLSAEMDAHLADEEQHTAGNHRNGFSPKTVTLGSTPLPRRRALSGPCANQYRRRLLVRLPRQAPEDSVRFEPSRTFSLPGDY